MLNYVLSRVCAILGPHIIYGKVDEATLKQPYTTNPIPNL